MPEQKRKDKYITTTEPKIYGVEVDNNLIYVGKTHVGNINGKLIKSNLQVIYMNNKLNKITKNKEIKLIEIKDTDIRNWYKDRNHEAHFRFINGEVKLLNDPWILEGKNGYWEGKERDEHTLQRLSESKFKKIVQYDVNGKLIKVWGSGKSIGIEFLKDYVVSDGAGKTKIYLVLKRKIKNRLFHNSYWFKEEELLKSFSKIPIKLNIGAIIEQERIKSKKNNKYKINSNTKVFSVRRLSKNKKHLHTYFTAEDAAKRYKVNVNSIRRACRLGQELCGYFWEYGEKQKVKLNKKTGKYTKR